MVKLQAAAGYPGYWPALQLLVEIELEVDIQASHLRALNRLQSFCMRQQAMLDYTTAAVNTEREAVWYKPATWVGRWRKGEMIAVCFLFSSYPHFLRSDACCGSWKALASDTSSDTS